MSGRPVGSRCAFAAAGRGDPTPGTAAPATGFLLVEQPGPWGRAALTDSGLDPAVGRALLERGAAHGRRPLLIRRPGRTAPGRRRRWFEVDARPGRESVRTGTVTDDRDLLRLPPGDPHPDPLFLVCTHGRHDACCAIRGRPVAAALAAAEPEATWECSHVGGDRFAANLLVLPHGVYYGRVAAAGAREVAAAYRAGRVRLDGLRGRAGLSPAEQAAQYHARTALGELRLDALVPLRSEPAGRDGAVRVVLAHDGDEVTATVRVRPAGPPALLTCSALRPAAPPDWELVELAVTG